MVTEKLQSGQGGGVRRACVLEVFELWHSDCHERWVGRDQTCRSLLHIPGLACFNFRDQPMRKEFILQPRWLKVAGWCLQLSVKAGLGCGEAALLMRMFAEERHVFPVGNHGICNIKRPAFHATNHHAASLSRNETTSSTVWGRCTPAAIGQTGDHLGSIQEEVLFAQVVDVKAHFILSLLDSHYIALLHLCRRLAVHFFTDGVRILPGLILLAEIFPAPHYIRPRQAAVVDGSSYCSVSLDAEGVDHFLGQRASLDSSRFR